MLHMTNVKLIPDPDLYIFFEKGMRSRVSDIFNRYIKANNTYLKPYYPKQESKHIIYLDGNNLYGYAMSNFLRASGFKRIDPKEFDLNKYTPIVPKDVFSKLTQNILKSYENYTIIIL